MRQLNNNAANPTQNSNVLRKEDLAVHNWYRFVLSFPPHLVRDYIDRFDININNNVLDPFCGTGTTLVECKKIGIPSIGIEANPMARFASMVKVSWSVDPDRLLRHAYQIADITLKNLESEGIHDLAVEPLLSHSPNVFTNLRKLSPDTMKLLIKNSISPLPLHKTLVLLETLEDQKDDSFISHELLALAKAIVSGISNLHFGPEVGVGTPKPDAPVVSTWLHYVRSMVNHLNNLNRKNRTKSMVYQADSRRLTGVLEPKSVDAVITSPPYPNEKDYTRTTRLESVLLGFIRTKQDLRSLKNNLLRSNTRNVYKTDRDDLFVSDHEEIQRIANSIEKKRIKLGKTSGFERLYARVTRLYFGGMARHLADLRSILRPGARLAYVVGDQSSYLRVKIHTGIILADIARSLGFEVVGIDLFRTRLATATRKQLREEVVILRWPGN